MNKTLYIRDEDATVWDRARQLAGEKLSPVIVDGLRRFIAGKEAEASGFERIVVTYRDSNENGVPRAKAFYGRWLISPKQADAPALTPIDALTQALYGNKRCAVAVTAKGSVVAHYWTSFDGKRESEQFCVFGSFAAGMNSPVVGDFVRQAYERLGVPVEELDI